MQPEGYDPIHRFSSKVVYTPSVAELVSSGVPNEEVSLIEHAITLQPFTTYPHSFSSEYANTEPLKQLGDELVENYWEFREETTARSIGSHRLFGYPDLQQNDMHRDALLVTNGYNTDVVPNDDERILELYKGSDDWILLLQLASDETLGTYWGDWENVYFWIRKQDLAASCPVFRLSRLSCPIHRSLQTAILFLLLGRAHCGNS